MRWLSSSATSTWRRPAGSGCVSTATPCGRLSTWSKAGLAHPVAEAVPGRAPVGDRRRHGDDVRVAGRHGARGQDRPRVPGRRPLQAEGLHPVILLVGDVDDGSDGGRIGWSIAIPPAPVFAPSRNWPSSAPLLPHEASHAPVAAEKTCTRSFSLSRTKRCPARSAASPPITPIRPSWRAFACAPTSSCQSPARPNRCTTLEYWSPTKIAEPPGVYATACGKRNTPLPVAGDSPRTPTET